MHRIGQIATLLLTLLALRVNAQEIRVPDTRLNIVLPAGQWDYLETLTVDKNTNVYIYVYTDSMVITSDGDTTLPFMRVYVRKKYNSSAYELAYERFLQQPFQSMDEYTITAPSEGIGYIGAYRNTNENRDYQFRMIYFKDHDTAFEIRLEVDADQYHRFDSYFDQILQSINLR